METNSRNLEFTGKTVEEAIDKGLAELGISKEQAEITVLSQGSRGLLGLGAEDARVAVRMLETAAATVPQEAKAETEPTAEEDEAVVAARDALTEMLRLLGITCRVDVQKNISLLGSDSVPFVLDIQAEEDLGVLIGRRGETLAALQYLTRLIVGHKTGQWVDLAVDVQQYKVRRGQALQGLAQRMAERVVETGRAIALEAMPPAERRIVHLTLRDHPKVTTQSIGEGENRKVMILPKE